MGPNRNDDNNEISNINITPMVDIMLVLLIIFMVTANLMKKQSINLTLPKVESTDPNTRMSVQIAIQKDGTLLMEGVGTSEDALVSSLENETRTRPNMRVTLSADESLEYKKIASIMGLIKKAGVSRIALSVKR